MYIPYGVDTQIKNIWPQMVITHVCSSKKGLREGEAKPEN